MINLCARFCVLFAALGLVGCGGPEPLVTFDAYEGPRLPDSELAIIGELHGASAGLDAIIKDGNVVWKRKATLKDQIHFFTVDVDREQVRLTPGRYQVQYVLWCASDFSFISTGDADFIGLRKTANLDLIAGHVYTTNAKYAGYLCHRGRDVWIEDQTTGRVLGLSGSPLPSAVLAVE